MSNSSFSKLVSTDDGKVVWSGDLGNIDWSAIYLRGFLYETVSDTAMRTHLQCADMSNGNLMWGKSIKMPTFTEASDKLIILDEDGILHIAEATPKGYQELSSGDALGGRDDVARKFWTPPVLVGGRLYYRNYEGQLVCIDMRK